MMDVSTFKDGLIALSTVASLLALFYAWLTSGSKKNTADIADLKAAREVQDRKLQTLDEGFKHLPDKDVVHRLELGMKDMQIQMASMATSQANTERTARRVEEYLLTHGTGPS
jgi:hypothetical protein